MAHPKLQSIVGYCTNVHAGADLTSVRENLEKYSLDVKRQVRPDTLLGIGSGFAGVIWGLISNGRLTLRLCCLCGVMSLVLSLLLEFCVHFSELAM